jgi:Universal stress protein family
VLNGSAREAVDPDGPVKVSSTVHEGNAAQVLLDASEGADLLVVGSRGHGGFTEALLGSVSQAWDAGRQVGYRRATWPGNPPESHGGLTGAF